MICKSRDLIAIVTKGAFRRISGFVVNNDALAIAVEFVVCYS